MKQDENDQKVEKEINSILRMGFTKQEIISPIKKQEEQKIVRFYGDKFYKKDPIYSEMNSRLIPVKDEKPIVYLNMSTSGIGAKTFGLLNQDISHSREASKETKSTDS